MGVRYIIKQKSTFTRTAGYWRKGGKFIMHCDFATRLKSRAFAEAIIRYEKISDAVIEEVTE